MANSKTFHTKTLPELHERLRILDVNIAALEEGLEVARGEKRNIEDLLKKDPSKHKFDVPALKKNLTLCDKNLARIEAAIAREKESKVKGHEMIEEARERDALIEASTIEINLERDPARRGE